MFQVTAVGYNFVHRGGWEISRPNGFRHYLLIHIRNPFYYEEFGTGNRNPVRGGADPRGGGGRTAPEIYASAPGQSDANEPESVIRFCPHPAYLLFRPADPEHFFRKGTLYADDWVHFDDADGSGREMIRSLSLPYAEPVILSDISEIAALHQILDGENLRRGPYREEISDRILQAMLLKINSQWELQRQKTPKAAGPNPAVEACRRQFNQIRSEIYQGNAAARVQSVEALAERANMSTSYFQHIYKALFGVPVTKDLIQARIRYARFLLENQSLTISDVAEACGYASKEHFNRQFRSVSGCSPTEYQKKIH